MAEWSKSACTFTQPEPTTTKLTYCVTKKCRSSASGGFVRDSLVKNFAPLEDLPLEPTASSPDPPLSARSSAIALS